MTREQKIAKRFTERFLKIYYTNHDRKFESCVYKMVYENIKSKHSRQAFFDSMKEYKTREAKQLVKDVKEVYR